MAAGEEFLVPDRASAGDCGCGPAGLGGQVLPAHYLGKQSAGGGGRCRLLRDFRSALGAQADLLRYSAGGVRSDLYGVRSACAGGLDSESA